MLRRCVLLLVMMGLIANPLVAGPHAHAGMTADEQREHDATPHFHSFGDHHGSHVHAHHAEGSSDGHGHHEHDSKHVNAAFQHSMEPVSSEAHDSTSIPCSPSLLTRSSAEMNSTVSWQLRILSAPLFCVFTEPIFSSVTAKFFQGAPVLTRNGSDLYLLLRNLRI